MRRLGVRRRWSNEFLVHVLTNNIADKAHRTSGGRAGEPELA
jgi:hypothetical protein